MENETQLDWQRQQCQHCHHGNGRRRKRPKKMHTIAEQNRLAAIITKEIRAKLKWAFQDSALTRKRFHADWRHRYWEYKQHPKRPLKRWIQLDKRSA